MNIQEKLFQTIMALDVIYLKWCKLAVVDVNII